VGDVTPEEIDALLARMKLQFRQIDQALRRLAKRLPKEQDSQIAGDIRTGLQDAVRYTAVWAQLADAYPTVSVVRQLEAALNSLSAIVLRLRPYL
jgi:hypothetical protein